MLTLPDKLLIALLAVLTLFSYSIAENSIGAHGREVSIEVDAKQSGVYSLSIDRVYNVEGVLGVSRIALKDGKASFISSPCKNKLCVHQGEINKAGQMAACLPNRVVVRVTGGNSEYDAVTR